MKKLNIMCKINSAVHGGVRTAGISTIEIMTAFLNAAFLVNHESLILGWSGRLR